MLYQKCLCSILHCIKFSTTNFFFCACVTIIVYLFFNSNRQLYDKDGADFVTTLILHVEQEVEPDDVAQSILSFVQK